MAQVAISQGLELTLSILKLKSEEQKVKSPYTI
jgi:hypothetical protein